MRFCEKAVKIAAALRNQPQPPPCCP